MLLLLACATAVRPDGGDPPVALANCTGTLDFDAGVDGVLDGRWVFRYNDLGDPIDATWDMGADGGADARMLYLYSGEVLTERDWDGGADGIVDNRTFYEYDQDDHVVEERTESGGVLSDRVTYDLDGEGEVQTQWHWSGNGSTDLLEKGSFRWADGLKQEVRWQTAVSASTVRYTYDDRLLQVEEIRPEGKDTVSQRERTTWDEDRRKLRVDKDVQADGQPDYRSDWSYACD